MKIERDLNLCLQSNISDTNAIYFDQYDIQTQTNCLNNRENTTKQYSPQTTQLILYAEIILESITTELSPIILRHNNVNFNLYDYHMIDYLSQYDCCSYVISYKSAKLKLIGVQNAHHDNLLIGLENITTSYDHKILLDKQFIYIPSSLTYNIKTPVIFYGGSLSMEPLLSIEQSIFWITKKNKIMIKKLNQSLDLKLPIFNAMNEQITDIQSLYSMPKSSLSDLSSSDSSLLGSSLLGSSLKNPSLPNALAYNIGDEIEQNGIRISLQHFDTNINYVANKYEYYNRHIIALHFQC